MVLNYHQYLVANCKPHVYKCLSIYISIYAYSKALLNASSFKTVSVLSCFDGCCICIRVQQWIGFSLLISTYIILTISESTLLKFNYVLWFIHTQINIDLWTHGCNEYEYNVNIELILFEICLVHTPTHCDSWI